MALTSLLMLWISQGLVIKLIISLTAFSIGSAHSTRIYTNPDDLGSKEYDFIVVGAGTAGNVIAARLSEDPTKHVLVIEAGIDDTNVLSVHVPFFSISNQRSVVDWNFTTVPQKGLDNRTVAVPRGFVLGGSSSINHMAWTRGSKDLWDHYAEVTGDSGWSWDALQKYWNKVSTLVPPTSNPSIPPPPPNDPTLSNGNGPVLVTTLNFPTEIDERVINASILLEQQESKNSSRFKFNEDINTGDSIGFGYTQHANGHGERSSSATAYLHPALNSNRTNLDVLIQTRVMRLLQDSSKTNLTSRPFSGSSADDIPYFNRVEVAQSVNGPRFKFHAKNEIILSAGSIGTPHIMLLSGVGPKDELEEMGIDVVADRSPVGKNLRDHPLLSTLYSVNSDMSSDDVLRNPALQQQLLEQWETNMTGLFANTPAGSLLGFLRLPEDQLRGVQDPASGPRAPHIEILFSDGSSTSLGTIPPDGHFIAVRNAVVAPKSVGSLTIASAEGGTFTQPLINYNIYSDPFDIQAMLQAINDTETFLSTTPWTRDGFIISLADKNSTSLGTTDEKIAFMRNNTGTVYHPVGTAAMGMKEDSVTDSRLRVRGVKGVRVVDASVFPTIPECHTQAVVYTLAERAADIIKEDNGMPL